MIPDLLEGDARYRRARDFARSDLLPHAADWERAGVVPREVVAAVAREGWLAVPLAGDGDARRTERRLWGIVNHQAGAVSGSLRTLLTVQTALAALTLRRWGAAAQRDRWLPRLADATVLAAFALSEPGSGSDAGAMTATYRRDGGSFRLDGEKCWVSFGLSADMFLLFATGETGAGCFLVPRDAPGLRVEPAPPALGLRASATAT